MTIPQTKLKAKWDQGPTVETILSWREKDDDFELYAMDLQLGLVTKDAGKHGWLAWLGTAQLSWHGTNVEAQLALYQEAVMRMAAPDTDAAWHFSYELPHPAGTVWEDIERQARYGGRRLRVWPEPVPAPKPPRWLASITSALRAIWRRKVA